MLDCDFLAESAPTRMMLWREALGATLASMPVEFASRIAPRVEALAAYLAAEELER